MHKHDESEAPWSVGDALLSQQQSLALLAGQVAALRLAVWRLLDDAATREGDRGLRLGAFLDDLIEAAAAMPTDGGDPEMMALSRNAAVDMLSVFKTTLSKGTAPPPREV